VKPKRHKKKVIEVHQSSETEERITEKLKPKRHKKRVVDVHQSSTTEERV